MSHKQILEYMRAAMAENARREAKRVCKERAMFLEVSFVTFCCVLDLDFVTRVFVVVLSLEVSLTDGELRWIEY